VRLTGEERAAQVEIICYRIESSHSIQPDVSLPSP